MSRNLPRLSYGEAVAALRVGIGLLGLFAPDTTQRAALLNQETTAEIRLWTRFWATRALGLGLGYLTAEENTRRQLMRVGLFVDLLDTAFLATMCRGESPPTRALVWLATITATSSAADAAEIYGQRGGR